MSNNHRSVSLGLLIFAAVSFLLAHVAASTAADESAPDALAILRAVEKSRLAIASGRLELAVTSTQARPGKAGTDHVRLKVIFNGDNRRFDQYQRWLVIDGSGPDRGEARRKKLDELEGDREAFVRLGLGQWQDAHICSVFDGSRVLQYQEGQGVVITDPGKGFSYYLFDPRTLGLTVWYAWQPTIAQCLGYAEAKAVSLIGAEKVSGRKAWHVNVLDRYGQDYHFWVDGADLSRVLKCALVGKGERSETTAEYGGPSPGGVMPARTTTRRYRDGKLQAETVMERTKAEFNIPIDPASWTLAGLGIAVGEPVSDDRIHRRIGYWNGTGLSEQYPGATRPTKPATPPPHAGRLLAVAEKDPKSALAFDALSWIVANEAEGPDKAKAMDLLIRHHARKSGMATVCERMVSMQSGGAERLFRAVMEGNPHKDAQGMACYCLALLLKEQSEQGNGPSQPQIQAAAEEAAQLLSRVVKDYPDVKLSGRPLAEVARPELFELRHLGIGKVAPEIQGSDLEGKTLKLSDYRGKVVVLNFWGRW